MRVAYLENNVVVEMREINVPISDYPGIELVEAGAEVAVGFTHSNGVFTPHATHQAEKDAETIERDNATAREFLKSTDWMSLRDSDGGTPMTQAMKQLRADAREKVI
jgi:hypothetical protein